jgi:hypothetical protein
MKFAGDLRSKIGERKVLRGFGVLVCWTRSGYSSNTFDFAASCINTGFWVGCNIDHS